jgi:hypothetical protein
MDIIADRYGLRHFSPTLTTPSKGKLVYACCPAALAEKSGNLCALPVIDLHTRQKNQESPMASSILLTRYIFPSLTTFVAGAPR